MAKYIFVVGGVLSSLGKGIAAASIGVLLKSMGHKVQIQKLDPYLNLDPGQMSPLQHGEVFVTDDGAQADLDLGHYERFLDQALSRNSSCSAGQIYESVLRCEAEGRYQGRTVQVIPHVTDEIKRRILELGPQADIVIVESGGTVGDIEILPFLEAVRQLRLDLGVQNTLFVMLTYIPWIRSAGELKTKPAQHSAYKLREIGIQPEILLCRSEKPFGPEIYDKIALFTNVPRASVINAIDVDSVYECPLIYREAGLHKIVCRHFGFEIKPLRLAAWKRYLRCTEVEEPKLRIAVCGKYVQHRDAYKSVGEALTHAAAFHGVALDLNWIDSSQPLQRSALKKALQNMDGILVEGGLEAAGLEGEVAIAEFARKAGIPFLGICLGMQAMAAEFARNVCGLKKASSQLFDPNTPHPLFIPLEGGTRLGARDVELEVGSQARKIFKRARISERQRHRQGFNLAYREALEAKGLSFSGFSPDEKTVEVIELPSQSFHIGVQFHPQFKSRPNKAHPLFKEFLRAALEIFNTKKS